MIDAGLFILVTGLAFVFMIISFKMAAVLRILAMVLFFILSLWMLSGEAVAYQATTVDSNSGNTFNSTKYIISNTGLNDTWLGWIFFILGILNGFLFFIEMVSG